jgi:hypothetical protein
MDACNLSAQENEPEGWPQVCSNIANSVTLPSK